MSHPARTLAGPPAVASTTPEERAGLRPLLDLDPAPAKHGEPLTPEQERRLTEMIAETPEATHPAIARRFAAESGRCIAVCTVQARRGPGPAGCRTRPMTPEQAEVLEAMARAAGPSARRADVARDFEARTARLACFQTITAYAIRIHGPRRLRPTGLEGGPDDAGNDPGAVRSVPAAGGAGAAPDGAADPRALGPAPPLRRGGGQDGPGRPQGRPARTVRGPPAADADAADSLADSIVLTYAGEAADVVLVREGEGDRGRVRVEAGEPPRQRAAGPPAAEETPPPAVLDLVELERSASRRSAEAAPGPGPLLARVVSMIEQPEGDSTPPGYRMSTQTVGWSVSTVAWSAGMRLKAEAEEVARLEAIAARTRRGGSAGGSAAGQGWGG